YIRELLENYRVTEAGTRNVPMNAFILHSDDQTIDDSLPVRELIGSLQYLAHKSRPDIAATVQYLSRSLQKPTKALFAAAKNVLRYLKGTLNLHLQYRRQKTEQFETTLYTDAHFGPKPVSGTLLQLNKAPVNWISKKHGATPTSTAEAELYALSEGLKELRWIDNLLLELGIKAT